MNTPATSQVTPRFGHKLLSGEDAAVIAMELKNKISIALEGVDILRGSHEVYGYVTILTPVAGESCLLHPFEKEEDFCYK